MITSDFKNEPFYIRKSGTFLKNKELITTHNMHVFNVAPFLLRSVMRIKRHSCNTRIKKLINRSLPKKRDALFGFVLIKEQHHLDMYFETRNKDLCFLDYAKLAYVKVVKEREYLERLLNKLK